MKLETERLILRKPRMSDWKDIVEGIGNIEVSRTLSGVPHPYKKEDAFWWLKKTINELTNPIAASCGVYPTRVRDRLVFLNFYLD